jgi:hypothetical protein
MSGQKGTVQDFLGSRNTVTDFENILNPSVLKICGEFPVYSESVLPECGVQRGVEEDYLKKWPVGPRGIPVKRKPAPETDPVEFARVRLGFEPDERQAEVLRSEAKQGILNCTRQWGKSTVSAAKAVHRAYTRPKSLVLVASPSERQSGEFVRRRRRWFPC